MHVLGTESTAKRFLISTEPKRMTRMLLLSAQVGQEALMEVFAGPRIIIYQRSHIIAIVQQLPSFS